MDKLFCYQGRLYKSGASTAGSGCCMELMHEGFIRSSFMSLQILVVYYHILITSSCCCPVKPAELIYYSACLGLRLEGNGANKILPLGVDCALIFPHK